MVQDFCLQLRHNLRRCVPYYSGHYRRSKKCIEEHFDRSIELELELTKNNKDEKPCLKQLIECYDEYKTSIVGVQTVAAENVNKYGIVDGIEIEDRVMKVKGLVEKPDVDKAHSNVAILGRNI